MCQIFYQDSKSQKDNIIIFLIIFFANRVEKKSIYLKTIVFMVIIEYLFKVGKHLKCLII
jgi:hypothetical protein